MIDHEKLKIAHELCQKTDEHYVEIILGNKSGPIVYLYYEPENMYLGINTIDECIKKLKEITQPQPKYKDCSKVWFCDSENNLQECTIINYCNVNKQYILYDDCVFRFLASENRLFPTKLALIQAQCEYWNKLEDKELEKDSINE